jgi:hypothetical protein
MSPFVDPHRNNTASLRKSRLRRKRLAKPTGLVLNALRPAGSASFSVWRSLSSQPPAPARGSWRTCE